MAVQAILVVEYVRISRDCVKTVVGAVSLLSRPWKSCLVRNELIEGDVQLFLTLYTVKIYTQARSAKFKFAQSVFPSVSWYFLV
jgi:hypothetical protein